MIVYVPGRMPSAASYTTRFGPCYQPAGYYGQQVLLLDRHHQQQGYAVPVSPPATPPSPGILQYQQQLLNSWPRVMPQDEEMTSQHHANVVTQGMVVNGPPSPAHSDSDASSSSLELGSVRREEDTQLKCRWKGCGKWFTALDDLARHVQDKHSAPGPRGLFYCGWEDCQRGERGFNARYKMLVHVRTHTNEKPHRCSQCEKSFSRAENLKIHARSHTGERPYACIVPGCNKAYSNSSDRFKHTRTHAIDKPYCCKIPGCLKRYTDPSSLRKHVKTYRHYVNNNDKGQEKSFEEPMQIASVTAMDVTPEKMSVKSPRSDSDKKDSSLESNVTTSTSVGSISSDSLKAASSTSFEEQQKLVDWNNTYNNLQESSKDSIQTTISSSSPLSLSLSLSSSKSSYEHEATHTTGRYSRGSIYDDYPMPSLKQPTPTYPIDMKHCAPASPPDHLMAAIPRIGMQSTPIKSEDKAASGVDYRNIESIVNSTPVKKEGDIVRNSVIKRADAPHLQSPSPVYPSTMIQQEPATGADATECCCKHKCCRHAENDKLLEKTKILSDLILKSPFRHLLASVDLQYSLQSMWSSSQQQLPASVPESANTCAQDLRSKSGESLPTDMEQDLPLDLTINK